MHTMLPPTHTLHAYRTPTCDALARPECKFTLHATACPSGVPAGALSGPYWSMEVAQGCFHMAVNGGMLRLMVRPLMAPGVDFTCCRHEGLARGMRVSGAKTGCNPSQLANVLRS